MKLYKALIRNRYVVGTRFTVDVFITDNYRPNLMSQEKSIGSVTLTYQCKKKCVVCDISVPVNAAGSHRRIVRVELLKTNVTQMQNALANEDEAKNIFLDSSIQRDDETIIYSFGSFRFLNSIILFNIPASMLQIL